MQVNLHDAKTHLSRYLDQAVDGEEVVIARAGKPLVAQRPARRLGFLTGQGCVDAYLKRDFEEEINAMFGLASDLQP